MIGLAVVEYALVCVVLHYWKAGGVKHASEIESGHRGKAADVGGGTMQRAKMDVEVRGLRLIWRKRGLGAIGHKAAGNSRTLTEEELDADVRGVAETDQGSRKVILDDISLRFPAGEVSAILVSRIFE